MLRRPIDRLLALSFALSLAACAAYQAQHGAAAARTAESGQAAATVRPSGEFSKLSPDQQAARVRGEAEEAKASLARQGRYACCIHPSCNECLHKYGQCHCRDAVRKEGPCCGECTEGWLEGKGTVEGAPCPECRGSG